LSKAGGVNTLVTEEFCLKTKARKGGSELMGNPGHELFFSAKHCRNAFRHRIEALSNGLKFFASSDWKALGKVTFTNTLEGQLGISERTRDRLAHENCTSKKQESSTNEYPKQFLSICGNAGLNQ